MTAGNGHSPHGAAFETDAVVALRERLADSEDRVQQRIAELTAADQERRALQADVAVKADWLDWMRRSLDTARTELAAARDELARLHADRELAIAERDQAVAERDRAVGEAAVLRRDARLFDSLRRSAHRVPLYRTLGHSVVRPLLDRRSG
jgi:chromosome segregation ATPase